MANTHPSEETIERFAMGRLAEPELACFEEHLLVCPRCQESVTSADQFIQRFKSAARQVELETRPWKQTAFPFPKTAAAAAAAVLLLVLYVGSPYRAATPQPIALTAMRGLAAPAAAAGTPLALTLDTTGLAAGEHTVEVVDSNGNAVFNTVVQTYDSKILTRLSGLPVGQHWVRVYTGGILSREYSLVVK